MDKPTFELADIPDNFEIELRQDFVDQLDKLNRPYKYTDAQGALMSGHRVALYWEAGELHRRTLDKMTDEDREGYKRRHSLFERLWGRHRFKDYHFPEGDPLRYVDTGSWIRKSDIDVIREGIHITDEELSKAIVGFRKGKGNDIHCRELRFPRLPIKADKWWAWFIGIYFSSGTMYEFHKHGPKSAKGGSHQFDVRIRSHYEVQPKLMEVAAHIGAPGKDYAVRPKHKFSGTKQKLGAGRRTITVFGWPTFLVLAKFGVPMVWRELGSRKGKSFASRGYKPEIPNWIKKDDTFMHYFIEGFLNGGQGYSFLARSGGKRSRPVCHIGFNMTGKPVEMITKFLEEIERHLTKSLVKANKIRPITITAKDPERVKLQLAYTNYHAIQHIHANYHITRNDMRARNIVALDSREDRALYEALRLLQSYQSVLLGVIYEHPRTHEELLESLQMRPEDVEDTIQALLDEGLIILKDGVYMYWPIEFVKRREQEYRFAVEEITEVLDKYLKHLLYQCQSCDEVYMFSVNICHYCGGEVNPIPRENVVKQLSLDRRYQMYQARLMKTIRTYETGRDIEWRSLA
jgi:hypothetical protein